MPEMVNPIFTPKGLSSSPEEEKAYRRGFDQGVSSVFFSFGVENRVYQKLGYNQRISSFRYGHDEVLKVCNSHEYPQPTKKEKSEIREAILNFVTYQEAQEIINLRHEN